MSNDNFQTGGPDLLGDLVRMGADVSGNLTNEQISRLGAGFWSDLARMGGDVDGGPTDAFVVATSQGSYLQAYSYATPIQEFNGNWYVGLITGDQKVSVAKSIDQGATWTSVIVNNGPVADDAHNVTSIGIDALGYIHCAYNMHVNGLRYSRSVLAEDISAWTPINTMGLTLEDQLTYPQFFVAPISRQLHFSCRRGSNSSGTQFINKLVPNANPALQVWSRLDGTNAMILDGTAGSGAGPYPFNLAFSGANDDITMTWGWLAGSDLTAIFYAKFDRAANVWRNLAGAAYTLPITVATGQQVVTVSSRSRAAHGMQTFDANGDLHIGVVQDAPDNQSEYYHTRITSAGVVTTSRASEFNIPRNPDISAEIARPLIWSKDGSLWMFGTDSPRTEAANFAQPPGDAFLFQSRDAAGTLWKSGVPVRMLHRGAEFNLDNDLYNRTGDIRIFAQTVEEPIGPTYVITEATLMAARQPSVDLRYMTSNVSATDAASYPFNNLPAGDPAPNRRIVFGFGHQPAADQAVTAVTIGGIVATQLATIKGGNCVAEAWIADVPDGTTVNVLVTLDGVTSRAGYGLWAVYGGGVPVTATSNVDPASVTMDALQGGVAVGYGIARAATGAPGATWSGNMTERFDVMVETFTRHAGSDFWARADGEQLFTCDWSTEAVAAANVFVTFEPS